MTILIVGGSLLIVSNEHYQNVRLSCTSVARGTHIYVWGQLGGKTLQSTLSVLQTVPVVRCLSTGKKEVWKISRGFCPQADFTASNKANAIRTNGQGASGGTGWVRARVASRTCMHGFCGRLHRTTTGGTMTSSPIPPMFTRPGYMWLQRGTVPREGFMSMELRCKI